VRVVNIEVGVDALAGVPARLLRAFAMLQGFSCNGGAQEPHLPVLIRELSLELVCLGHLCGDVSASRRTTTQDNNKLTQTFTRAKTTRVTPVRPVKSTGQTSVAWEARDEQHLRSTLPNPNFDLPNHSTDLNKTFGI
jgi:hypothetical protein